MGQVPDSVIISKLLDEILKDVDELIKTFPEKSEKVNGFTIGMFFTMIEITTDIGHLVKIKRFVSIPSLVRNFMDTYVDLLLITLDQKNIYPLMLKVYDDNRKVLEGKINNGPHFIKDKNELAEINKRLIEKKTKIGEIKKKTGSKIFTSKDKYKNVGLLWFYETIYRDLCSQTHNGLSSIEERHIEQVDADKILIKYLQPFEVKDFYECIIVLLNYFHASVGVINKTLNLKQNLIVERMEKRISEIITPAQSLTFDK